jgi:hypothetical protein
MDKKIKVLGTEISLAYEKKEDYISSTHIARYKNNEHPADVIKNWTRVKDAIDFLWLWERINNSSFELPEFGQSRNMAGSNSFALFPKKSIETLNVHLIKEKISKIKRLKKLNEIAIKQMRILTNPPDLKKLK